jgi:hypothetical protein
VPQIHYNRQSMLRRDTGACCIEHKLLDRNGHAIRAQIVQAENALAAVTTMMRISRCGPL